MGSADLMAAMPQGLKFWIHQATLLGHDHGLGPHRPPTS
jgi:hypothetical protein